MADNKEFLSTLKSDLDLFGDMVYCFTPAGDVKTLPAGSNTIDFAYSIHSAVGNRMVGARVNGRLVTIDYEIKNGDRIEVITSQNSKGPSRDWLKIAKSAQAKNKINQWFKQELKEDNITKGKELLMSFCKAKNIDTAIVTNPDYMQAIMDKYNFRDWDGILAAVGHGGLKEGQIVNKMVELYEKDHPRQLTDEEIIASVGEHAMKHPHTSGSKSGIVVKGIEDVAVRFSKCCSPVPGDEIVGFVTRGRGISIHRNDCINILNLSETDRSRLIDAEWQADGDKLNDKYLADIRIYADDRPGLLGDVSRVFTERGITIITLNSHMGKNRVATMTMSFEISGRDELKSIADKLRNIDGIIDIERSTG